MREVHAKPAAGRNETKDAERQRRRAARTAGQGSYNEVLTVLASGVLFVLLLFLLFRHLFPAASWRGDERSDEMQEAKASRQLTYDSAAAPAPSHIATLLTFGGDVKVRPSGSLAWNDAHADLILHADDAVQTFARSTALLRLDGSEYLELGERSLIVLSDDAPDRLAGGSWIRRGTLLEGVLTGTLGGAQGGAVPLELSIAGGQLLVAAEASANGEVTFMVSRNPDSSSSISLFAGNARFSAARQEQRLEPGFGVTLDAHGTIFERRRLPPAPAALEPAGDRDLAYRDVPPRVVFRWQPVDGAERYRVRIARDAQMEDVLYDERVTGSSYTLSDLRAGEHYWAVSALDGWHEGRASAAQRLRIVKDAQPPFLVIEEPAGVMGGGRLVVRGRTEPGARVYVQGQPVEPMAGGEFETEIAVHPGASLLVVEAADEVGNVSYSSRIVTARETERAAIADTGTEQ